MFGRPDEALAGRTLSKLLREFIGLENVLKDIFEGKRSGFRLEQINRVQSDGAIHYLTFQVAPFEVSRPEQGLLLLVEDTTDYGRLQQANRQDSNELSLLRRKLVVANEELARVNQMRSSLMSKAAHDLKGPLTSTQGFATILKEDITDHEQLEFLDIIIGQFDCMRRLIDNLLAFDQIEQGHLGLDWHDCNLNEVVDKALNALRSSAEIRKHSLIFNQPDRQLVIWPDSNRLNQVVYNLVDNAIKYILEDGQVFISLRQRKSNVEIEVADCGLGMSDDQIAHIFGQNSRANDIHRSNLRGSGLGLYLPRALWKPLEERFRLRVKSARELL
ncbi:MAG TPA: HAMP domain-containing sensor histidine kinase [Patescibacteria group bacterium]|nr:HAMP domain-containing sensor histidine kinase [Patescibacteria group bacterium]